MALKDRQLKDLRRELEVRPLQTTDEDIVDDYSDVLEVRCKLGRPRMQSLTACVAQEELRMMKESFQRQLREAEDKREQLVSEHIREQNEWGRQKKELKGVEKGLLMQLERLQRKYDALRVPGRGESPGEGTPGAAGAGAAGDKK